MATSEIEYRTIEQRDKNSIVDILMNIIPKNEVISVHLEMEAEDARPFAQRTARKSLRDRVSVVAVHKQSGDIVGIMLNILEDQATCDQEADEKASDTNDKLMDYSNIIEQVSGNVNFFQRFNVDKIFFFCVLCVLPGYKKRGIAKSLVYHSIQNWKDSGIPLAKVETTSYFSQKIFESFDFELFTEKRYDEIMLRGKPFMVDEKVHTALSIWTKRLEPR